MSPYEWQVRILTDRTFDFQTAQIAVFRDHADAREWCDGTGTVRRIDHAEQVPDDALITIPFGALEALRDEALRIARRDPTAATEAVLREALDVERARIDAVLAAAVSRGVGGEEAGRG